MSDEGSAIPQEQSERLPPPRPPRTAVGAPFARGRDAAPFRSTGATQPSIPWGSLRGGLFATAGFLVLGFVLRVFAEAPQTRSFGGALILTGILLGVLLVVLILGLRPLRLPSFLGERRRNRP